MVLTLPWMHTAPLLSFSLGNSVFFSRQDALLWKGETMLNGFGSKAKRAAAPDEKNPAPTASGTQLPANFNRLPGDEIERLIALCEAPVLLWEPDPGPARAPEPFGMIA